MIKAFASGEGILYTGGSNESPTTCRGRPPKTEDTKTFVSIMEISDLLLHSCHPSAGVIPAFLARRLNCVLNASLAGSGLFGPLSHPVPEGSKSRALIAILYVPLYEAAHDIAGAFSLLSCQSLEVILQVIVDPYG